MPRPELTPEQLADADRIHDAPVAAAAADLRELAELLATKDDRTPFGVTEFRVRDIAHRVGVKALGAAADVRKKKATTAAPGPAPAAARRPSSGAGSRSGS
jgi:hypothetical protein